MLMKTSRVRSASIRLASILCLLVSCICIFGWIGEAEAASTTTFAVGSITLYPGRTGNVPVMVTSIPVDGGLGAYNVKMAFNPSVISILDVLGGSSPFNAITAKNIDNTRGEAQFNHFITDIQGPTGDITIAYLNVRAVGNAGSSSALNVIELSLVNARTGEEITPRSVVPGSVAIVVLSSSSITLSLGKDEIKANESMSLSGAISPAHSASVTLTFVRPVGSEVIRTTISSADGSYKYTFSPDMAGSWTVVASWHGDADHEGASSFTANFSVRKLESAISVAVSPVTIEPEGSVRIEGYVVPSHSEVKIRLEYRFSGGKWVQIAVAETNATGGYSFFWVASLTVSGRYEVRASWGGDWDHHDAASPLSLFSVKERSTLSIRLSSDSTSTNGTIVIMGQVFPVRTYVDLVVSIESPNGTMLMKVVYTDAAGNYRVVFAPDVAGVWSFKSSWLGDNDTIGSESSATELTVTNVGSSISLQVDTASTAFGGDITLSGQIKPAPNASTVTVTLTRPDSTLVTLQTLTANGSFSVGYTPDQAGGWLVEASWDGDSDCAGATSLQVYFTVSKLASTLSLSVSPPIPRRGDLLTFEGILGPPFPGCSIRVIASSDDGRTWSTIASSKTGVQGEYSVSWRAEKMGCWMFKAEWVGDEERSGCTSNLLTLAVREDIISKVVILPNGNETRVLLSASSPIDSSDIDLDSGRIEVKVAGTSGMTGVVNIFIPNELLDSYGRTRRDLVSSIDGVLADVDIVRVAGGYLVAVLHTNNATIAMHYVTYSLTVATNDYQKVALAGANVTLTGPIRTSRITDSSGKAYFAYMPKGNYTVHVYYGSRVAGGSVDMTESKMLTIDTTVGKIELEYAELMEEYTNLQSENNLLKGELNVIKTLMYAYMATAMAFVAVLLFSTRKKSVEDLRSMQV